MQFSDRIKNVFHTRVGQKVKGDVKIKQNMFEKFEVKEVSKTFSQNGLNFDFVRMINPQLYGLHYQEYNERLLDSNSGEYAYLDLIDSIIKNGKGHVCWSLKPRKQKGGQDRHRHRVYLRKHDEIRPSRLLPSSNYQKGILEGSSGGDPLVS